MARCHHDGMKREEYQLESSTSIKIDNDNTNNINSYHDDHHRASNLKLAAGRI